MAESVTDLWEILVPVKDNTGHEFPVKHHRQWDDRVREITGGLTIMRTAKGQWLDHDGELFNEKMIPVRLACNEKQARKVMDLTLAHYKQLVVMAYRVSDRVIVTHAGK